jgi:superkiller protein 3
MASNKAALKAAKSAIDGRKYEETIIQAQKVLESDPGNYHG